MILTVENSKTTKNYIYGVVGLIVLVLLVSVGAIYYNANKENRKYGKLVRTFADEMDQGNFKSSLIGLITYLDTFIEYDSTLSVVTITKDVSITNDLTIGNAMTINNDLNIGNDLTITNDLTIGNIDINNSHFRLYSPWITNVNDVSLDIYSIVPNKYGFGIRPSTLAAYTGRFFRLYNSYGDKNDSNYIFEFDTSNNDAIINSNTTINGSTSLKNTIYTNPILSVYSPVSDGSTNSPVSLSLWTGGKQFGLGITSSTVNYFSYQHHKWFEKTTTDNSLGTLLATLNAAGLTTVGDVFTSLSSINNNKALIDANTVDIANISSASSVYQGNSSIANIASSSLELSNLFRFVSIGQIGYIQTKNGGTDPSIQFAAWGSGTSALSIFTVSKKVYMTNGYITNLNDNNVDGLISSINANTTHRNSINSKITISNNIQFPNTDSTIPILSIYSPTSNGSSNSPVSLSLWNGSKQYGLGIASSTLNYFSNVNHKWYAKPNEDNTFGTLLATLNNTGLNIPESLTVGANAVILGDTDLRGSTLFRGNSYSTGYLAHKYNGGNSTFAIYSNYALMGDGVSMGYNAYVENGAWVYPNGAANSRMHLGYGAIYMSFGTGSAGGPNVFTASAGGVTITPTLNAGDTFKVKNTLPIIFRKYLVNNPSGGGGQLAVHNRISTGISSADWTGAVVGVATNADVYEGGNTLGGAWCYVSGGVWWVAAGAHADESSTFITHVRVMFIRTGMVDQTYATEDLTV